MSTLHSIMADSLLWFLIQNAVLATVVLSLNVLVWKAARNAAAANRHFILSLGVVTTLGVPFLLAVTPAHGPKLEVGAAARLNQQSDSTRKQIESTPASAEKPDDSLLRNNAVARIGDEAKLDESNLHAATQLTTKATASPLTEGTEQLQTSQETSVPQRAVPEIASAESAEVPAKTVTIESALSLDRRGWGPAIATVWAIGIFVGFLHLLHALRFTARLRRTSDEVDMTGRVSDVVLARLRANNVQTRVSSETPVPVLLGPFRSVILVPEDWSVWSDAQLESIVTHELAHVVRHDVMFQLLSRVLCAIFWWQPLAWMVRSRLQTEQEFACDDAVLLSGYSPTDYADHLVLVAERLVVRSPLSLPVAVSMATNITIESRIRSLLSQDTRRDPMSVSKRGALAVVATLAISGSCAARPLTVTAESNPAPVVSESLVPTSRPASTQREREEEHGGPKKEASETQDDSEAYDPIILAGIVVDADGKLQPDVSVSLVPTLQRRTYASSAPKATIVDTTDEQGRFQIKTQLKHVVDGQLIARREAFATTCRLGKPFFEGELIRLVIIEHQLVNVAVKTADGTPVPNALVRAHTNGGMSSDGDSYAETNSSGVAVLYQAIKVQNYESPQSYSVSPASSMRSVAEIIAIRDGVGYGEYLTRRGQLSRASSVEEKRRILRDRLPRSAEDARERIEQARAARRGLGSLQASVNRSLPETIEIKLSPFRYMSVRLTDDEGKPVPGQPVKAKPIAQRGVRALERSVTTNDAGDAKFQLPANGPTKFAIGIDVPTPLWKSGHSGPKYSRKLMHDLANGDVVDLTTDVREVAGRVTGDSGPVAKANVQVRSLESDGTVALESWHSTDIDGQFRVAVMDGLNLNFEVTKKGLMTPSRMLKLSQIPNGIIDFKMSEMPPFSGQIFYRDTDIPIAFADLQLQPKGVVGEQQRVYRIEVDYEGKFETYVRPGRYQVKANIGPLTFDSVRQRGTTVTVGQAGLLEHKLRYPLDPPNTVVDIIGFNGKAVPNAQIYQIIPEGRILLSKADASGRIDLRGLTGDLLVTSEDGKETALLIRQSGKRRLFPGKNTIELQPPITVKGRLVNGGTNQPHAGITMMIAAVSDANAGFLRAQKFETDAEGRFAIEVSGGNVRYRVYAKSTYEFSMLRNLPPQHFERQSDSKPRTVRLGDLPFLINKPH